MKTPKSVRTRNKSLSPMKKRKTLEKLSPIQKKAKSTPSKMVNNIYNYFTSNSLSLSTKNSVKKRIFPLEGKPDAMENEESPSKKKRHSIEASVSISQAAKVLAENSHLLSECLEKSKSLREDEKEEYLEKTFALVLSPQKSGQNIEQNVAIEKSNEICDEKKSNPKDTTTLSDDINFAQSVDWGEEILLKDTPNLNNKINMKPCFNPLIYCIHAAKNIASVVFDINTCEVASKYKELPETEQKLYLSLLLRKWSWKRVENINYNFVSDLKYSLSILKTFGFVENMHNKHDLKDILTSMQLCELKQLCELQNIDKNGKKEELLKKLLLIVKNKSVFSSVISLEQHVKERAMKILNGKCIKLVEFPRETFLKFVVASTCPYYIDDECERLADLKLTLENLAFNKTELIYLNVKPQQLFKTLTQFEQYFASIQLKENLQILKNNKKWEEAAKFTENIKDELKLFLNTSYNVINFLEESSEVNFKRFTAGANLAYCVSSSIDVLKRVKHYEEALASLDLLLSQKYFVNRRRALWYQEKALIMEKYSKESNTSICEVLLNGLMDPSLTLLGRRILSKKAEMYINKKSTILSDLMKRQLTNLLSIGPQPTITTIFGQSMPNVSTSKKQLFKVTDLDGSKTYLSVEEKVIDHYKSVYPQALHDEGLLLRNIVLAVFFPVIYETNISGVFISELQEQPLDWGSQQFYKRRNIILEEYKESLLKKGIDGIIKELELLCLKICKVKSLINNNYIALNKLPSIKHLMECLTLEKFIKFADYLLEYYGERKSGFPDLTLFNPTTKQCAFVEVKGPSDTPSVNQILWLEKLSEFGLNAFICKVSLRSTMSNGKTLNEEKIQQMC